MTEVADRIEASLPRVGEPPIPKRTEVDRLSEPHWIDWCDADR